MFRFVSNWWDRVVSMLDRSDGEGGFMAVHQSLGEDFVRISKLGIVSEVDIGTPMN